MFYGLRRQPSHFLGGTAPVGSHSLFSVVSNIAVFVSFVPSLDSDALAEHVPVKT